MPILINPSIMINKNSMSMKNMKMEVSIKDINPNWLVLKLVKANFSIKKEVFMMVNGKTIICMAMANYSILIQSQHMKDNGILIDFMEKVKFIMINLYPLIHLLIIQILIT